MKSDRDIYMQMLEDNGDAFKQLFYTYFVPLVKYSISLIDNQEEAEDIVQDVLAHFWNSRHSVKITTSVKSYLFTAVKYRSVNYLKHRILERDHNPYVVEFLENMASEEYMEEGSEQVEKARKALAALPEHCRLVFTKTVLEGKSYKEIASELNISVNTVKSQVYKAHQSMRKFMDESESSSALLYFAIFNERINFFQF